MISKQARLLKGICLAKSRRILNSKQANMFQNEESHINIVGSCYLIEHCLIRLKKVLPYSSYTYTGEVTFRSWTTYD